MYVDLGTSPPETATRPPPRPADGGRRRGSTSHRPRGPLGGGNAGPGPLGPDALRNRWHASAARITARPKERCCQVKTDVTCASGTVWQSLHDRSSQRSTNRRMTVSSVVKKEAIYAKGFVALYIDSCSLTSARPFHKRHTFALLVLAQLSRLVININPFFVVLV